jgi:hypothetical protein
MELLLADANTLIEHIAGVLEKRNKLEPLFPKGVVEANTTSAVLFLLGRNGERKGFSGEPCLVLNKRSMMVRQPGDLCFPGGRISPRLDFYLSKVLKLPFFPLMQWPYWPMWRDQRQPEARRLALLFATGLRESLEEMRLNPLGLKFLGPMPSQALSMFDRVIYPMVVWIRRQKHFLPNWEVKKVVYIPLRNLLNPEAYACYRVHFKAGYGNQGDGATQDFPCFRYENENEKEVLWGVTFRIVVAFLELVFGFKLPDMASLPMIYGTLDETYVNRGQR